MQSIVPLLIDHMVALIFALQIAFVHVQESEKCTTRKVAHTGACQNPYCPLTKSGCNSILEKFFDGLQ